ncbi:MAG: DUF362 domain-containing protein [Planctomycetes bacterium]|nr:DUF362 domain-containing protein [Planctomycetota bacterium]
MSGRMEREMSDGCPAPNTPHGPRHHHPHREPSVPPARGGAGIGSGVVWLGRYLYFIVLRNRYAIALASLVWLIWRSGSQPRRLAYPCQQAAAANLGFLAAVPLLPRLHRRRRTAEHEIQEEGGQGCPPPHAEGGQGCPPPTRHHRRRAFVLLTGAGYLGTMLFITISGGIALFSTSDPGQPPQIVSATSGTGVPATVSIVKDYDGSYTNAQLDQMVRRAVALAGGLEPVMVDRRGGGSAPWDTPDGNLDVVIIPNMTLLQPGLNTDPRVTKTVVAMAWEAGADSVALGGAATGDNWTIFREQGYDLNSDHLLDWDTRVPLIDLNDTGTTGACASLVQYNNVTLINLPTSGSGAAVARSSYYINNALLKADAMIVVPALKNHNLGTVTLSLKMRIGTAPQDIYFAPWLSCTDEPYLRWEMHNKDSTRFPWNVGTKPTSEPECVQRSLVDLNLIRPHDFTVIDALVGCESGPITYDEPSSRVKSIMASRDCLAIDTIGALVMGYNPDRIPCLNMANDTQVLGVKDRRLISVVGDHVKDTRVNFSLTWPTGYATPYPAESNPPTIGGISLTEGQFVVAEENSVVTCTGVTDDMGVIKAELVLKPADPPNLLVNGGFEAGAAGWSTYHAIWGGNDGQIDFNNTEPGRVGNSALHLYLPAGQDDSFAVYQQVPVTPGKAYRIDAAWKANYYGQNTWYEVMLIDGPWDPFQADTGGSAVLLNHMFAYDTNASANCPAGNPITASFGWTWTHDQYDQNVDNCWNDRDGVRVATGTTMTVVLKTGSCCGTNRSDVWFDEVSLTEVIDQPEIIVATVLDPPSTFDIVWDSTSVPLGRYLAHVSVYDAMMNEASITRNIEIVQPDTPLITVAPTSLQRKAVLGGDCADGTFTVTNTGIGTLNYAITTSEPWLNVVPNTGSSDGEPDTITVSYDCTGLGLGTHLATITVTENGSTPAPAFNSPQTIPVTVTIKTVRADYDQDGDVDQSDYGHMQACQTGQNIPITDLNCLDADLQGDGDVDLVDVNLFLNCKTGPGITANPACDPSF